MTIEEIMDDAELIKAMELLIGRGVTPDDFWEWLEWGDSFKEEG